MAARPLLARRLSATLTGLAAAALLLAGCGDDGRASGSGGSVSSGTPTASGTSTSSASFPITVTRSGGVAGFADRVVVQSGGAVEVSSKAGASRCTLDPTALALLEQAAARIRGTVTGQQPSHPDDVVIVVESPKGSARLSDAELSGASSAVNRLLDELSTPQAERRLCT